MNALYKLSRPGSSTDGPAVYKASATSTMVKTKTETISEETNNKQPNRPGGHGGDGGGSGDPSDPGRGPPPPRDNNNNEDNKNPSGPMGPNDPGPPNDPDEWDLWSHAPESGLVGIVKKLIRLRYNPFHNLICSDNGN